MLSPTNTEEKVTTLYSFIGEASHRDSPDSLNSIIVIADDAPQDIVAESMEDSEDATVLTVSRVEMDSIHRATDRNDDSYGMPDGHILDLVEFHILGWGE
jgi:hypothetical protein